VPGFGDLGAWLLIIGLAPAADGGNRTGRVFTGDESGRFLVAALYKTGFANQPTSVSRDDGLSFEGCFITAAVKCVPPENRPSREEFRNCARYLETEIKMLARVTTILALGSKAFDAFIEYARKNRLVKRAPKFSHGVKCKIGKRWTLYGSYHPSPRNTYTGKLTPIMLEQLLQRIKRNRKPLE
jgi:uracil-DNA glycosylase family 4